MKGRRAGEEVAVDYLLAGGVDGDLAVEAGGGHHIDRVHAVAEEFDGDAGHVAAVVAGAAEADQAQRPGAEDTAEAMAEFRLIDGFGDAAKGVEELLAWRPNIFERGVVGAKTVLLQNKEATSIGPMAGAGGLMGRLQTWHDSIRVAKEKNAIGNGGQAA